MAKKTVELRYVLLAAAFLLMLSYNVVLLKKQKGYERELELKKEEILGLRGALKDWTMGTNTVTSHPGR